MVIEGLQAGELRTWYDTPYPALDFALISIGLAVFWALLGVYRMMSMELQVRTTPVAWLAFCLFLVAYLAGFDTEQTGTFDQWLHISVIGFWVFLTLTYVAAFSDRRDPIALRRLVHAVRHGQWRRALEELPFWVISADLCLIAGIVATALALPGQSATEFGLLDLSPSAFLLMTRDIGILYFFSLDHQSKTRANVGILLFDPALRIDPVITECVAIIGRTDARIPTHGRRPSPIHRDRRGTRGGYMVVGDTPMEGVFFHGANETAGDRLDSGTSDDTGGFYGRPSH